MKKLIATLLTTISLSAIASTSFAATSLFPQSPVRIVVSNIMSLFG